MAKVLNAKQIEHYRSEGYLVLPGMIDAAWLERLRAETNRFVDASRSVAASNREFDLEPDHSAGRPRLRRLNNPVERAPVYWEFASDSPIVDVVEDLLGPNIKFHHGKLNFKFPHGGEEVKWHQDIQFWPHTNYELLTMGVYLEDVEPGQGEMGFIPRSHAGDLFDQYQGDHWRGYIQEADLESVDLDAAVFPTGPAGTVTVHSCRMIHGSQPNHSGNPRPLLLQTYAAADAFSYTDLVRSLEHSERVIRGTPARWARHDPRPCQVPPTRIGTIFQAQQKEGAGPEVEPAADPARA